MRPSKRTRLLALPVLLGVPLLLVVAILLLSGVLNLPFIDPFQKDYDRFRAVKVGMTEHEIKGLLGKPQIVYHKAAAPQHYYAEGWAYEERAITK